ncbi:cation-translocating P-type ATPase [Agromyces sp. SYSU T00194]|uniref:cation-translocating P-type ATPase n=1 Tax=Agromyces chitinivorans TaxID=3158560 RepID=UPI003397221B
MSDTAATSTTTTPDESPGTTWWSMSLDEVTTQLGVDPADGLPESEVNGRLAEYGENALAAAPQPSWVRIALQQLFELMTFMLVIVAIVSLLIGQVSTAIIVGILVLYNVWRGTSQELKARRSVDALAKLQVPQARVVRGGVLRLVDATAIVPGDVVELEAGDLVPADGRILRAANLETQEAALTGESLPIPKGPTATGADAALADRTSMVYQNTSITRGTTRIVVVETGMRTEVGRIAALLTSVESGKSPLGRELDSLTKVLGVIAWSAVAIIIAIGLLRGQELDELLFLGTAVAISAIPTGLPAFVQSLLGWGANRLAAQKAIVTSLNDVETLGATSAICSDKTGTLTLNEMTVRTVWFGGVHLSVTGGGYSFEGRVLTPAGEEVEVHPGKLAQALVLPNDASVSADGDVIGDPTEAALVVLGAKIGVDADESRRTYPRVTEVPFDSDYKYMATFHRMQVDGERRLVEFVKGAPDIVLGRCTGMVDPSGQVVPADADAATAALEEMSASGLRTLALAMRVLDDADEAPLLRDPQQMVHDLVLVGIVGIVDPLRSEAKDAVELAQRAGIEVRMITGDHAVTAGAIGAELGLGPGAISGADLRKLNDAQLNSRLGHLHVFGRVTPQDKLRLVGMLQQQGEVVAMTGDAVNDAAAIKQADIGVAMGSGSEVTKQAAKLVLTDDNFSTLVHAVELGRVVYDKIVSYLRFQMSQLFSMIFLFLAASAFAINEGVAMFPGMVLFLNFFITLFAVLAIAADPTPPGIMDRPPRDPRKGVANPASIFEWLLYGFAIFVVSLVPLVWGPDDPSPTAPSASMTMVYIVVGLATVLSALLMRRAPESGLLPPIASAAKILVWPVLLLVATTEFGFLQEMLGTVSLTGWEWLECVALLVPVVAVVEAHKWWMRHRLRAALAPKPVREPVAD